MAEESYKRQMLDLIDQMMSLTYKYIEDISNLEKLSEKITEEAYEQDEIGPTRYREILGLLGEKDEILKKMRYSLERVLERLEYFIRTRL